MSQLLTDSQLLHRQYLASPVWKEKRLQALEHYGCICNRCQKHGTDVHHKTYERVGGGELMEDLEVLCRPCHEAHHRAEKAARTVGTKKGKSINRRAIFRYLTAAQRALLIKEYRLTGQSSLSYELGRGDKHRLVLAAAKLLGFSRFHGGPMRKAKKDYGWGNDLTHPQYRAPRPKRPEIPWDEQGHWLTLDQFRSLDNPLSASSSSS